MAVRQDDGVPRVPADTIAWDGKFRSDRAAVPIEDVLSRQRSIFAVFIGNRFPVLRSAFIAFGNSLNFGVCDRIVNGLRRRAAFTRPLPSIRIARRHAWLIRTVLAIKQLQRDVVLEARTHPAMRIRTNPSLCVMTHPAPALGLLPAGIESGHFDSACVSEASCGRRRGA